MLLSSRKGGNMTNLQQANEYTKKIFSTKWLQWVHEGTKPAESNAEKNANVLIGTISKHCAMCLNLNGCCFVEEKCPTNDRYSWGISKILNQNNLNSEFVKGRPRSLRSSFFVLYVWFVFLSKKCKQLLVSINKAN